MSISFVLVSTPFFKSGDNMKNIIIAFVFTLSSLMYSNSSFAEGAVIVNIDNLDILSNKQLRRIFLGKLKHYPSGRPIKPIVLFTDSKLATEFNREILKISNRKFKIYWAKKQFTGRGIPPKAYKSSKEILKLVTENKGMIGYIDSKDINDDITVIRKF